MKLSELEPTFIGEFNSQNGFRELGAQVDGAQGVMFTCPKCGNHQVLCFFLNPRNAVKVPDAAKPGPGRWTFSGESFDVLSLTPSVDLSKIDAENPKHLGHCYWHGFVTNGEVN